MKTHLRISGAAGWGLAGCLGLVQAGCSSDDDAHGDSGEPDIGATAIWESAFDTSTAGALSGVWGTGPDDVFIVGGSEAGGEVYHYDGSAWSPMDVPSSLGLLVWSYGFGPDNVFAVGVGGSAAHYDGTAWTALDTGVTDDLWGVWGTADDDLWVVGGDSDGVEPTILHWDGTAFTTVALDPAQNSRAASALFKVWGIGSKVFAVGQRGLIVEWTGSEWIESFAGAEANQDFVSLWGTSEDNIVCVGGRGNARVAEYDGSAWTTISPPTLGGLNAVYMTEASTAAIGGVNGFVGTYAPDGDVIETEQSAVMDDVHAIWGDGQGMFYAVGGRFLEPYTGFAMARVLP